MISSMAGLGCWWPTSRAWRHRGAQGSCSAQQLHRSRVLTAVRQQGLNTIASEMHTAHFSPADASAIAAWQNVLLTHEAKLLAGVNCLSATSFCFLPLRSCPCPLWPKPPRTLLKKGLLDLLSEEQLYKSGLCLTDAICTVVLFWTILWEFHCGLPMSLCELLPGAIPPQLSSACQNSWFA